MGAALDEAHQSARDDALLWPKSEDGHQPTILVDDSEYDEEENRADNDMFGG